LTSGQKPWSSGKDRWLMTKRLWVQTLAYWMDVSNLLVISVHQRKIENKGSQMGHTNKKNILNIISID
jgi:hypothetical protein